MIMEKQQLRHKDLVLKKGRMHQDYTADGSYFYDPLQLGAQDKSHPASDENS